MADTPQFELNTPLGQDLKFHRLEAHEALGTLSHFSIECFSEKVDINLDAILGKMASVKIMLPGQNKRFLTGYITRFAHVGTNGRYQVYAAEVRPWPWFLTRTTDCRIFQNKTVPEIVKEVFADHQAIAEFRDALTGTYRPREYCVQYRESDLDFVCRLFEDEGIYFFFEYESDKNVMVLADAFSAHSPAPGLASIEFVDNYRAQVEASDHITDWRFERVVQPGKSRLVDYDFKRPKVRLDAATSELRGNNQSDHEVFDYPGNFEQPSEGSHYARVRLEELQSQYEQASASTNARALGSGHTFELKGHARGDQNREYLVIEASITAQSEGHEAQDRVAGSHYSCAFKALQSQQEFRPQRHTPKPRVQGLQTAVVVGPEGDEIYTDKYGRIKVQFFWDRRGQEDENSSCWMRVSQPWAGKNWGFISIPRIGQEVVVEFLEGDPDRPLITGSVYNGEQMPPHDLPAHKTTASFKSRSSTGAGPESFNELRFEDKKGQEHIYLHAERNLNEVVEQNHSSVVGLDQMARVARDRMSTVGKDATDLIKENSSFTVGINQTTTIGSHQTISVGGTHSLTVGANDNLTVGAHSTRSIGASEIANVGGSQHLSVGGGQTTLVGGEQKVFVTGSKVQLVGGSWTTVAGRTSSHMATTYKISAGNFQLNAALERKTTVGGKDELKVLGQRSVTVGVNLSETIGGMRTTKVGGVDQTSIGGARTTKIAGADNATVGGAISVKSGAVITLTAGGLISITAGGVANITATAVTISSPVISLNGNVMVAGTLTVAGVLTTTSLVSPIYTPGVGNMI